MIYGYACIDIQERDIDLKKQVEEIKGYFNRVGGRKKIIKETVNIREFGVSPSYKKELKTLLAITKEGDIVVFASIDNIFPTRDGIVQALSFLFSKGVTPVVLDMPSIQNIEVNPYLASTTPYGLLYDSILKPLLEYRDSIYQQGELSVL